MRKVDDTSLGHIVRRARRALGLNQAELGEQIGQSKAWVVDVELGHKVPTDVADLLKLSQVLQVDLLDLVSRMLQGMAPSRSLRIYDREWEMLGESMLPTRKPGPGQFEIRRAAPRSYNNIAIKATDIALTLFPEETKYGDAIPILEALLDPTNIQNKLSLSFPILVDYSKDQEWEGKSEFNKPEKCYKITLRADVFARAKAGVGRDRFTAAHEFGHVLLHGGELRSQEGTAFRHTICTATENLAKDVKIYESPEWQANVFASALLMPTIGVRSFIKGRASVGVECSIEDLADNFRVSMQAARIRLENILPSLVSEIEGQS